MHEFPWLDLPATRLPSGSTPLLVASFTTNVEENTEKFSTNAKNSIWFGFIPSSFFVALCFWFVAIVHRKRGRLYDNQFDSHCVCVCVCARDCQLVWWSEEGTNERASTGNVRFVVLCDSVSVFSLFAHYTFYSDSWLNQRSFDDDAKTFFSFPFLWLLHCFRELLKKLASEKLTSSLLELSSWTSKYLMTNEMTSRKMFFHTNNLMNTNSNGIKCRVLWMHFVNIHRMKNWFHLFGWANFRFFHASVKSASVMWEYFLQFALVLFSEPSTSWGVSTSSALLTLSLALEFSLCMLRPLHYLPN